MSVSLSKAVAPRGVVSIALLLRVLLAPACVMALGLATPGRAVAQEDEATVLEAVTLQSTAAGGKAGGEFGINAATSEGRGTVLPNAVTATKGAGPVLASPQPVSVVGRDEIEGRNVQSVDEATRYSSGVQSQKFGANNRLDWFNIRGFPANEDGLFLDGLALFSTAFATWQIDPVTLDRVEVLKGPASVLYGGSSPGGIVNLVSKRPLKERHGSVEAGVDEDGQVYSDLDTTGPLDDEGIWTYRLNARAFGGDYHADIGDEFRGLVAPVLTVEPDARTSFTLYGSYRKDDSNNVPGFLPYGGTVKRASFGRIDRDLFSSDPSVDAFEREQAMIGYEFEHSFNETFTVRQKARYAHLDSTYAVVYGFGYAAGLSFLNGLGGAGDTDIGRINFRTDPDADTVTIDTQGEALFSTGPVDHKVLAGLDHRYYTLDDLQGTSTLYSPLNVVDPVYGINIGPIDNIYIDNTQTLNQTGFYLQDQMTLDRLVVTLNGRYDFLDTKVDNNLAGGLDADSDKGAFSGRAGLAYLFDNGIAPYASYSRFFTPVLGLGADGSPFESGDGEQYEAGVKYQPTGFDGFFTASVFDLARGNVLTLDSLGANPFQQVQTGEIRSRGIELEGTVALSQGLSLMAAYTSFDLEVTESSDIDLGNTPVATPQEFASLWLDYAFRTDALEGLRVGGGIRWVGDSYADKANTLKVDDYTAFDAAVSYEKNNWKGSLNASNLFDDDSVASCSDANSCFYSDPRKVTASLSYKW